MLGCFILSVNDEVDDCYINQILDKLSFVELQEKIFSEIFSSKINVHFLNFKLKVINLETE